MHRGRRQFLAGAASLVLANGGWATLARSQERKGTRLILLGTKGGPRVGGSRNNPSTLLLINGMPYVVDCGAGTSRQLVAAGVSLNRLRYFFFTHLHSDHMLEYGPVVYNGWITGLRTRVDAYGPPPLKSTTQAFWEYVRFDVDTRIEDEGRPDPRHLLVVNEFDAAGIVMQNDDVKVTSAAVLHPPIKHAYAFRFDAKDRSIVISGDTNYAPALVMLAKGADVLVHEVLYLPGLDRLLAEFPTLSRCASTSWIVIRCRKMWAGLPRRPKSRRSYCRTSYRVTTPTSPTTCGPRACASTSRARLLLVRT